MNKGRCLGLVGGLGVGATVHYYQALTQAHRQHGRSPDIIITHAETSRVFEYVQTGDRDGLADYLLGFIRRMHSAGAELAAIPAVTPHFCIGELLAQSPVPLIDLFQPLKQELARRKLKRVAIFGTRFVIESALFGLVPEIEIISPRPEEIEQIHGIYSELAQSGNGTVDQHSQLTFIARDLCSREKVEAILLAGTDLSLLFIQTNTDFPHIDCSLLHIQAILRDMLPDSK